MLWDFAILYLSSSFVQNNLPSVFDTHSSVCSLVLASAAIVTRHDQGVEVAGALDLSSSKGSDKPVV